MAKIFLLPIGFHENIPMRILVSNHAGIDDKIIILTCRPAVVGVKAAFEQLKSQCIVNKIAEPLLLELPCGDPYESIIMIKEKLRGETINDAEVIVGVGGGLRILSHLATIALTILDKPYTIHYVPEAGAFKEYRIPEQYIETIMHKLTKIEQEILKIIVENPGITIKEIASTTGKKEKTIANIATRLKHKHLITRQKRKLYPTPQAKTLV